jgi:hypothetical protein
MTTEVTGILENAKALRLKKRKYGERGDEKMR